MNTKSKTIKIRRMLKVRNLVLNTVCISLALAGLVWVGGYFWKHYAYEITNDAYIDQYISPVNIRVAGYIRDVRFREHQFVHQGDTLVVLDDQEYRIKVKEAEAALLKAKGAKEVLHSDIQTSRSRIVMQEANIAEAEATLWLCKQDYLRYEKLLHEDAVPQQQYEQVKAAYKAAIARHRSLMQQKESAVSEHTSTTKETAEMQADILDKEAELDLAKLNLSYTVIIAPYDGYMGRRTLEAGQYVQAGQTLSYLVRNTDKWITANYLETQVAHLYIGQMVRIKVDAVRGKTFHGRVSAISEATGSKYSLVPTDNAAGNFVKVQQRIPVRIELTDVNCEDMTKLRAGMMVITEALKE